MTSTINPTLKKLLDDQKGGEPLENDLKELRKFADKIEEQYYKEVITKPSDVAGMQFTITAYDGDQIECRFYSKDADPNQVRTSKLPCIIHFHGGGYITGDVSRYSHLTSQYVSATGVPVLSVDYRLAPEYPAPIPQEDGFSALQYLYDHCDNLMIDPNKIILMGESSGAGLALSVAALAAERGIPIAKQILIYPMLDANNTEEPDSEDLKEIRPYLTWTHKMNKLAFDSLLSEKEEYEPSLFPLSDPNVDWSKFPKTYLETVTIDILNQDGHQLHKNLTQNNVQVEFHEWEGLCHGFEPLLWTEENDLLQNILEKRYQAILDV